MSDNGIPKELKMIDEEIVKQELDALSEPTEPSMSPRRQNLGGRQNASRPGKPFKSLLTPTEPSLRDEPDPNDPDTMPIEISTKQPR